MDYGYHVHDGVWIENGTNITAEAYDYCESIGGTVWNFYNKNIFDDVTNWIMSLRN